jgi:hypothetical protein
MAQVRIMHWKEIPYGVRASDGGRQVTRQLPPAFQEAVDAAAMADGDTDAGAYQAGFAWAAAQERPGTAEEAADAVVAEIIASYPADRLQRLARREPD